MTSPSLCHIVFYDPTCILGGTKEKSIDHNFSSDLSAKRGANATGSRPDLTNGGLIRVNYKRGYFKANRRR